MPELGLREEPHDGGHERHHSGDDEADGVGGHRGVHEPLSRRCGPRGDRGGNRSDPLSDETCRVPCRSQESAGLRRRVRRCGSRVRDGRRGDGRARACELPVDDGAGEAERVAREEDRGLRDLRGRHRLGGDAPGHEASDDSRHPGDDRLRVVREEREARGENADAARCQGDQSAAELWQLRREGADCGHEFLNARADAAECGAERAERGREAGEAREVEPGSRVDDLANHECCALHEAREAGARHVAVVRPPCRAEGGHAAAQLLEHGARDERDPLHEAREAGRGHIAVEGFPRRGEGADSAGDFGEYRGEPGTELDAELGGLGGDEVEEAGEVGHEGLELREEPAALTAGVEERCADATDGGLDVVPGADE
ncbi:hypothetical protein ACFPRL_30460 [Pseudoclavibacter helvolus]